MKRNNILGAAIAAASLLVAACGATPVEAPTVKEQQAQKAQDVANSLHFSENGEIDNIKRRLELTSNPGQIGFILVMNDAGQPIIYESVKGKITSGSKRLTQPQVVKCLDYVGDGSNTCTWTVTDGPSDEGTYGSSAQYIYYWNTDGSYRQFNGTYVYSDKPFRTRVEPLIISVAPKG